MSYLVNEKIIDREFSNAQEFKSVLLENFIDSVLISFKSHFAYSDINRKLQSRSYIFKVLDNKVPVFCIVKGHDIIVDLNYIDKTGVIHQGKIDINPKNLYSVLFFGSILHNLRTGGYFNSDNTASDKAKRVFFRTVSDIISTIFVKLFAKKYGLMMSEVKLEQFKVACKVFVGKRLFYLKDVGEFEKYDSETNYHRLDNLDSYVSHASEYENFVTLLNKTHLLHGLTNNEFKNSLLLKLKTNMQPAFDSLGYAIALLTLVGSNSRVIETSYIKTWKPKAYDILVQQVSKNLF